MLDIQKHAMLFNPTKVKGTVAVVGAGAVGSMLALGVAKLGVESITVYDDDTIAEHNIANQYMFGHSDVGKTKVGILQHKTESLTGTRITGAVARLGGHKIPVRADVVALCVDTMEARKNIFEKQVFMNGQTTLVLDTRVNAHTVYVYAFNPNDLGQVDSYRETLYDDASVPSDAGSCGVTPSIGATAQIAAALATWMFMDWINGKHDANEVIFAQQTYHMSRRKF